MSPAQPEIDLERFARKAKAIPAPTRRWKRFALPGILLAGFLAVLVWSLGEVFTRAVEVRILRPRQTASATVPGSVAFQAAGWVEPDPFPLRIVPLTEGMVTEILVQESDLVKKGDPVARLLDADAKLELEAARAQLSRAEAEQGRTEVELDFAKQDFDAAIAITERVEVAQAGLSGKKAEHERLLQSAKRSQAEVQVAVEELRVQKHLAEKGAAGPRQVELAQARLESARAMKAAADATAVRAKAEVLVASAKHKSAATEHKLRIEERRRIAVAERELELARARLQSSEAALAICELRLARMTVTSPWSGIVLERLTVPGTTVGQQGRQEIAICSLYDPKELRVRVDVSQEDIGKVFVGQEAEILSASRRGKPYTGRILRTVQKADIQKVTVQVHVHVNEPDGLLKPEMLCQVKFMASTLPTRTKEQETQSALMILSRLLLAGDRCWVLDPITKRAGLRKVTTGSRVGDWVEIRSGLNLSDKLIDAEGRSLQEGSRVRVMEGTK